MKIISTPKFQERADRTNWMHHFFKDIFLKRSVLDVGCFEAPLRELIGEQHYTGVDIVGNPDLIINLEQAVSLPFPDSNFETVICIEVLEHLENLHSLLPELFRLSSEYVLISLPNAWRDARSKIEKGKGSIAHYGLPHQRPTDRHKWFFSFEEASEFLKNSKPSGWTCEITATEPQKPLPIKMIRNILHPGIRYQNRYAQTAWALYRKQSTKR